MIEDEEPSLGGSTSGIANQPQWLQQQPQPPQPQLPPPPLLQQTSQPLQQVQNLADQQTSPNDGDKLRSLLTNRAGSESRIENRIPGSENRILKGKKKKQSGKSKGKF